MAMRLTTYLKLKLYNFPYFNKIWVKTLQDNYDLIDAGCSSLNTRLTAAEGKIKTLEGQMSTANTKISTLETNYTALEARVAALEAASTGGEA